MYNRPFFKDILSRFQEKRQFIQVISGPRQVGKTFLMQQVIDTLNSAIPTHYVLADEPSIRDQVWIEQQWEIGRLKVKEKGKALLVLDEIQKIEGWSETIKHLWDTDTASNTNLFIAILGSSPLLVQKGLTESLAGRFEITHLPHWSFVEMRDCFGWNLDQYIFFGGYPGATSLIHDIPRWKKYIINSLIETSISKDILLMKRVDKPTLLRRLFHLGCEYSGQILSYQKMLGQLRDAGNTTTLAHYLELLSSAWMLCGLDKYAKQGVRQRASSPKLQVLNNALMTASGSFTMDEAMHERDYWGRLVESAIGACLVNSLSKEAVYYWRERNMEVDFVVQHKNKLIGIEVKSSRRKTTPSGLLSFSRHIKPDKSLLIGSDGILLEDFFSHPVDYFLV